jgi:hypothetical protein
MPMTLSEELTGGERKSDCFSILAQKDALGFPLENPDGPTYRLEQELLSGK